MMLRILFIIGILGSLMAGHCQNEEDEEIGVVEFVQVKPGGMEDAIYYYEQNWKMLREMALDKGYINSYALMINESDSVAFSIILQTVYDDSVAYSKSEVRFGELISELGGDGPKLLSDNPPKDFRKSLGGTVFRIPFARSSK